MPIERPTCSCVAVCTCSEMSIDRPSVRSVAKPHSSVPLQRVSVEGSTRKSPSGCCRIRELQGQPHAIPLPLSSLQYVASCSYRIHGFFLFCLSRFVLYFLTSTADSFRKLWFCLRLRCCFFASDFVSFFVFLCRIYCLAGSSFFRDYYCIW